MTKVRLPVGRLRRLAVVVVSALLVLTGCTSEVVDLLSPSTGRGQEPGASTPFAERPPSEIVVAELDEVQAAIRQAVTAAVPSVSWRAGRDESGTVCGEPGAYGRGVSLPTWLAEGVSDDDWPLVVQALTAVATRVGFSEPVVVADRPGDHTVQLFRDDGAVIDIGSFVNMSIAVTTGCHPRG